MAADDIPASATSHIQLELEGIETWMKKLNVKVKTEKSDHVTFI